MERHRRCAALACAPTVLVRARPPIAQLAVTPIGREARGGRALDREARASDCRTDTAGTIAARQPVVLGLHARVRDRTTRRAPSRRLDPAASLRNPDDRRAGAPPRVERESKR